MSETRHVRLHVEDDVFDFRIDDKVERLGDLSVRQLWVPISGVYKGASCRALAECFWALCERAYGRGEPEHPGDRETYLLARLLPKSLTSLAAQVMPDRALGLTSFSRVRQARASASEQLKVALKRPPAELDIATFSRKTYKRLGMPKMSRPAKKLYWRLSESLLADAVLAMRSDRDAAVRLVHERWALAKRQYYAGRRWASPEAREALVVLSYECRAAVHECYSDTWTALLAPTGPLRSSYSLATHDLLFLGLWNTMQTAPSSRPDVARFDLWHGHTFSLHPALRLLIGSPGGRRLLGEAIRDLAALPKPPTGSNVLAEARLLPSFRRLLGATELALSIYLRERGELAEDRKARRVRPMDERSLDAAAHHRHDRRVGRTARAKPRSDFAGDD